MPNPSNIKTLGRTYYDGEILWCSHSGTGAEFTFTGTKAEVTVLSDSITGLESNHANYARIAIFANGNKAVDVIVSQKEKTYTVFESEKPEDVTVKIVKLSESAMSTIGIKALTVCAETGVKPTPQKDKLIEFIGDSITCGYGIDNGIDGEFAASAENATKSYAYLTAEKLNTDYSIVSFSGYGVYSGYSAAGERNETELVPHYYDKIGFSYGNMANGKNISSFEWDFTLRQPDIIVINLGTNDASYCKDIKVRQREFSLAYIEFLKQVRSLNPNAFIVCTLGMCGTVLCEPMENAVTDYISKTGDTKISSMRFDDQKAEDGYAADRHPSEETNIKAAEKLTEFLRLTSN